MAKLFNRAKMDTSTTGSGTITLGSAVNGYQSFADAGVADSDVVQYVIEDGTSWEIGTGTYSATGTSLTRTPSESSNSGAAISLTGEAEVFITAVADDMNRLQNAGSTKVEATSTGATVTGNLAVTGTVDGRDVATDGTKLDGIESNATADQTAAEIRSLVESATDSNVFTDADHTKLNGIESGATADQTKSDIDALGINADQVDGLEASQFLRSDTSDTMSGQLEISSGTSQPLKLTTSNSSPWSIELLRADTSFSSKVYNNGSGWYFQHTPYVGSNSNNVWHAGNDGSGSGLDADTVDGIQGANFVRSDTGDTMSGSYTMTGTLTLSQDGQDVLNFSANDTNDNRGIAFNSRTALSADYNDNWLRLNNASEFSNGVYTPANFTVDGNLDVAQYIRHYGDTNTYIRFEGDTISLYVGGSRELTATATGVRLGDTGNGYFQPVSGTYGSIQIDGGAHGGWEGYSIGGRAVFMHDNASRMGLYDDVNNEWGFFYDFNGDANMTYNGSVKGYTYSSGFRVTGNLLASSNVYAYYSDERLKAKDGVIEDALGMIGSLDTFYYYENEKAKELGHDNDRRQIGVSAQQVEAIMPEAVAPAPFDLESDNKGNKWSKSGEDYLTVDYPRLVPLLIKGIQELEARVKELENGTSK